MDKDMIDKIYNFLVGYTNATVEILGNGSGLYYIDDIRIVKYIDKYNTININNVINISLHFYNIDFLEEYETHETGIKLYNHDRDENFIKIKILHSWDSETYENDINIRGEKNEYIY